MFSDARPSSCSYLPPRLAESERTGAEPRPVWYANLMMGAHVARAFAAARVAETIVTGTSARTEVHTVPFHERTDRGTAIERPNAAVGVAKKAILVGAQAYRAQSNGCGLSSCGESLRYRGTNSTCSRRT